MGRVRVAYLDTHVAEWLIERKLRKLSSAALSAIEQCSLLISPMVLLEVEYLFEIGRMKLSASTIEAKLRAELDVTVCPLPFPTIAFHARAEKWTRDPFDRILVAHARTNGSAPLISADEIIRTHYPPAIW